MNQDNSFFSKKHFLILIAIFLVLRVITMAWLPIFDPSEARYAAMGRNMAVRSNFLEPQFVHSGILQNFEGKPPLFFQSSGVFCKLFGVNEFAVRFPALISAIVIALFVYYTVKILRDEKKARFATLLCMATPIFFVFAGLCMTDLMLAASVVCAIMSYMLFTSGKSSRTTWWGSVLFFASLGVGMIVKGPVALVMAGMPVFLYVLINNKWRELKSHAWFTGTIVFLLISTPWYIMMTAKNPDFLEYFFVNENFKRFLFKEYGDKYGAGRESFRGMAAIFYACCNLPFMIYGVIALLKKKTRNAFFNLKLFREPMVGLALLTILSNTLFWCLTSRVLLTYLLPTIPMTAIFLAEMLEKLEGDNLVHWKKSVRIVVPTFLLVTGLGLTAAIFCGYRFSEKMPRKIFKYADSLEEYRECKIYFANKTPYSAEFYLGDRVQNHVKEDRRLSLENSRDALLLITGRDLEKMKMTLEETGREELMQHGYWHLLAPVK